MRKLGLTLLAGTAIAATTSMSALADAKLENAHNCAGVFFSERAPEAERGGQQGDRARLQALAGERGENAQLLTGQTANCADNRPNLP